ncbi:hypothetical protein LMG7053_05550 [Achromobacter ruhlandii]|uniref:Uncharacterized protein n=1 Tax=Achromobacter ruhlandii TaxID=72557 RepID=A0ABM8M4Q3_9BURK|nr:hypothetical protein LMG7053_05550 [Achromobacter ruhlandii]
MLAQGRTVVFRAEQAAAAQFRQRQLDEVIQPAGQPRRHDVEAVGAVLLEPLLQLVGHALRRADHLLVAAGPGDAQVQLADRQVVAARQIDQQLLAALAAVGFWNVGQRSVDRVARQVEAADHVGQQLHADHRMDQVLQARELVLGLSLGAADHGKDAGHDLDVVGIAAVRHGAALDVAVERLGFVEGLVGHEDDLGGARRQVAAGGRGAGLHHHRPALRRARHVQRPAHGEMLAAVAQRMQLGGVEVLAAGLVAQEGVVLPTVPQSQHYVVEFSGAGVAAGVFHVFVQVEVLRLALAAGGHQVPARAAAADVVERGELARHVVGLVVGGGDGGDQADFLGHGGQRRQQRQRLEMVAARGARQRRQVGVAHADRVGQEDRIELGGLGAPRQFDVVAEVDRRIGLGLGMAPGGDVVAGLHQEGAEFDLARGAGHGIHSRRNGGLARAAAVGK